MTETRTLRVPKRIQRKRAKGWRMPRNTVYVGRPTKWANPFTIEDYGRLGAVNRYYKMMEGRGHLLLRRELRGKNLACWCPLNELCHADILLDFANRPTC
jgi:hypothetical protein